jgi:hypothetical protein
MAAVATASAPGSAGELRAQLATLAAEKQSLRLPIQELSRFAEIRRLLEKVGGVYAAKGQRFDFEEGIDPAEVLARLISGGGP